jgi:ankyrin repeat protein
MLFISTVSILMLALGYAYDSQSMNRSHQQGNYKAITAIYRDEMIDTENKKAMIAALVEDGISINASDSYGNTLLMDVVTDDDVDMTRFAIEMQASVNVRTVENKTPLSVAALNGFDTITEILLNAGAKLCVPDANGQTLRAVFLQHLYDYPTCNSTNAYQKISSLLERHEKIEQANQTVAGLHEYWEKRAAHDKINQDFHDALIRLDFGAADKALAMGAAINHEILQKIDEKPCTIFCMSGSAGEQVESKWVAQTLLAHYAQKRGLTRVSYLLERNANPLCTNSSNQEPCSGLLVGGPVNCFFSDLIKCSELEWHDAPAAALLALARQGLPNEILLKIAEYSSRELYDILKTDKPGVGNHTTLMKAVKIQLPSAMQLLLEGGADPDAKDEYYNTALTLAQNQAYRYQWTTEYKPLVLHMRRLAVRLQRWQTKILSDAAGTMPADFQSQNHVKTNSDKVLRLSTLFDAIKTANVTLVKNIIAQSPDLVNAVHDNGLNLIMYAIPYHNPEIIKAIIDNGGNVNYQSKILKQTALMLAAQSDTPEAGELIELLLAARANPNAQDYQGLYPFSFAVRNDISSLLKKVEQEKKSVHTNDVPKNCHIM